MARLLAVLLLCSTAAPAELDADAYFEAGVRYLKRGLFKSARAAFAESLVRSPGQPVPMAFLALAGAAEGRPAGETALLLRWAHARLPDGKSLRLDLASLLPSRRALDLLQEDFRARAAKEKGDPRFDARTVLACREVHDGDPAAARALDALLEELPADPFALALARLRPAAPEPAP